MPKNTHGGARANAGRPKGKPNPKTLDKQRAYKAYKQKIWNTADKLYQTQAKLAYGSIIIYIVEHYQDEMGKTRKRKVLVEDPQLIEDVLNDPDMIQGDNYFAVTVIPPDPKVITDMLDRGFGKPSQSVEMSGPDGGPIESHVTEVSDEKLRQAQELLEKDDE